MKLDKIIVDADICIKMGSSEKYLFLEELLPQIAVKIYIRTVVNAEIKYPVSARPMSSTLKKAINYSLQRYLDIIPSHVI